MPTIRFSGVPLTENRGETSREASHGTIRDDSREERKRESAHFGLNLREEFEIAEPRRGGSTPQSIQANEGDVFELVYSDGLIDFRTTDQLREAAPTKRGRSADGFELPLSLEPATTRGGPASRLIKEIRRFELPTPEDLIKEKLIDGAVEITATALALGVAKFMERQFWSIDHPPGLYRVSEKFELAPIDAQEISGGPYLILVHGTFSNTHDGFLGLEGSKEWDELCAHYSHRILALEHKSLSESPAENALQLVEALPDTQKTTLDLVTHSRGGLIGDLLDLAKIEEAQRKVFRTGRGGEAQAEIRVLNRLSKLAHERAQIGRYLRVASPSEGTTLASERLDLFLKIGANLANLAVVAGTGGAAGPTFSFLKSLALAFAGKRTDPRVLPGLEAMMPDSPYIRLLNGATAEVTSELGVVAGDIEGAGVLGRLKVWASDLFYRGDHDLVVDTASMYRGPARESVWASFQQGAKINHFNYFADEISRARLRNWLLEKPDPKTDAKKGWKGFKALSQSRVLTVPDNVSRAGGEKPPVLLFVPGPFTTALERGKNRLWFEPAALANAGLDALAAADLSPDAAMPELYQPMLEQLSNSFEIVPVPYTWTRSHEEEVKVLAEAVKKQLAAADGRPIHLLAHSGSGLLVALLYSDTHHRKLWEQLEARGGRAALIGPPMIGSAAIAQALIGEGALAAQLSLLVPGLSPGEAGRCLAMLPGLLELLPKSLLEPKGWRERGLDLPEDSLPDAKLLDNARTVRSKIRDAMPTSVSSVFASRPTVTQRDEDDEADDGAFVVSPAGDGFVTHDTAIECPGAWFNPQTNPDGLLGTESVADIAALLLGTPPKYLTQSVPASDEQVTAADRRPRTLFPTRDRVQRSALGLAEPAHEQNDMPILELEVLHGSLEYANLPIAVGHYKGSPIQGAEYFIDSELNGALTKRQMLDLYPGACGTAVIVDAPGRRPDRVLVIGMGEIGELSFESLRLGVAEAALQHAVSLAESRPNANGVIAASFASVLIGSNGSLGIPVRSSVAAIVQGVIDATTLLAARDLDRQVAFSRLAFVERYADVAEEAAQALREVAERANRAAADVELRHKAHVRCIEGNLEGRPPPSYQEDSWEALQIRRTDCVVGGNSDRDSGRNSGRKKGGHNDGDRDDKSRDASDQTDAPVTERGLEFTYLGRRAGVDVRDEYVDVDKARQLVKGAIQRPHLERTTSSLFEQLVPSELKGDIANSGNLKLVLDATAAGIPWELLRRRRGGPRFRSGDANDEALALRKGIVRQLHQGTRDTTARRPMENRALVIGDPPGNPDDYPRLPGAREEARAVSRILGDYSYELEEHIGDDEPDHDWMEVFNSVYAEDYRIIHIAAHGNYSDRANQSGVVIGPDCYLTAHDFAKLPVSPDVVFLNCCHVGRIDPDRMTPYKTPGTPDGRMPSTAANLAIALIEKGVRCVIAAGWPVGDVAARSFAETFYEQMLRGEVLGRAVQLARRAAYEADDGETNTWGAYQCYGDAGFRLSSEWPGGSGVTVPATEQELRRRVRDVVERVQRSQGESDRADQESRLDTHRSHLRASWRKAPLLYEFGRAYSEVFNWSRAIEFYVAAIETGESTMPVAAYEQLPNLEMREAIRLWREYRHKNPNRRGIPERVRGLRKDASKHIEQLEVMERTAERCALLAAHQRRLALLKSNNKKGKEEVARIIRKSADFYHEAHLKNEKKSVLDPYPTLNWLALCALPGQEMSDDADDLVERCRREAPRLSNAFWGEIAEGNAQLVLALKAGKVRERLDQIVDAFRPAFEHRSSYRWRSSVIEGTQDLADLHADAGQAEALRELVSELEGLAGNEEE